MEEGEKEAAAAIDLRKAGDLLGGDCLAVSGAPRTNSKDERKMSKQLRVRAELIIPRVLSGSIVWGAL